MIDDDDSQSLEEAIARWERFDIKDAITEEQVMEKYDISEADIEAAPEPEFE